MTLEFAALLKKGHGKIAVQSQIYLGCEALLKMLLK